MFSCIDTPKITRWLCLCKTLRPKRNCTDVSMFVRRMIDKVREVKSKCPWCSWRRRGNSGELYQCWSGGFPLPVQCDLEFARRLDDRWPCSRYPQTVDEYGVQSYSRRFVPVSCTAPRRLHRATMTRRLWLWPTPAEQRCVHSCAVKYFCRFRTF